PAASRRMARLVVAWKGVGEALRKSSRPWISSSRIGTPGNDGASLTNLCRAVPATHSFGAIVGVYLTFRVRMRAPLRLPQFRMAPDTRSACARRLADGSGRACWRAGTGAHGRPGPFHGRRGDRPAAGDRWTTYARATDASGR